MTIKKYYAPRRLDEAAQLAIDSRTPARFLAGGTDLMIQVRRKGHRISVSFLSKISRISVIVHLLRQDLIYILMTHRWQSMGNKSWYPEKKGVGGWGINN